MSKSNLRITIAKGNESYISKNGNRTYRYLVTGSPEAIAKYKELQGDKLVTDEATGAPMHFSTRFYGNSGTMNFNQAGDKVYVDTSTRDKQLAILKEASDAGIDVSGALLGMLGNTNASSAPAPVAKEASAEGMGE